MMLNNLRSERPNILDSKYETFGVSESTDPIDFENKNSIDLDLNDATSIAMPTYHEPDTPMGSDVLDLMEGSR
jgi:hypothetical protein